MTTLDIRVRAYKVCAGWIGEKAGRFKLNGRLLSRSPLAGSAFRRRDAREWLLTDLDPNSMAGFTYLDRVDLLAPPGQGLLLSVLKALQ